MKRQIQKTGVRKWFGDDFLDMQDEIYKAIEDGILSGVGNVVLGGCQIGASVPGHYSISAGIMLIDDRVCFYEGTPASTLPAYFKKEELETDDTVYADGNLKPTEKHFYAKKFATSQGGQQVIITPTGSPRLKIPYTTEDGTLYGIPKSDAINSGSSKYLATSKAVNDARLAAISASTLKYIKENFNGGEINQGLIPVGEVWLGKDGKLRISSTTLNFIGDITAISDVNAVDINAGNNVNADIDLNAGNDVNADGDVNAAGNLNANGNAEIDQDINAGNDINSAGNMNTDNNINFGGKANGDNAPKHLWYINYSDTSQTFVKSLGSKPNTGITLSYYLSGDVKACNIDFPSLPSNAIVIVTPMESSSHRSVEVKTTTANKIRVYLSKEPTGSSEPVYTTGNFSIAIYY